MSDEATTSGTGDVAEPWLDIVKKLAAKLNEQAFIFSALVYVAAVPGTFLTGSPGWCFGAATVLSGFAFVSRALDRHQAVQFATRQLELGVAASVNEAKAALAARANTPLPIAVPVTTPALPAPSMRDEALNAPKPETTLRRQDAFTPNSKGGAKL